MMLPPRQADGGGDIDFVVPAAPVRHAGQMPPLRQLYAAGGIEVIVYAASGCHANDNHIDPVGTAIARPQLT